MNCPMSNAWPLRTFKGVCSCGRQVQIRNDGKIPIHQKPKGGKP